MRLATDIASDLVERAGSPDYARWWDQVAATGYCAHPVRLAGTAHVVDRVTGEITGAYSTAAEPDGTLLTACGNRRSAVCPTCSAVYRSDTWQLVAAGLRGGKGLPATVTEHPALFVTFTAPSFGPVHSTRARNGRSRTCRPTRNGEWLWCSHGNPTVCSETHRASDSSIGSPFCSACYDYAGAVLFNALAPELWRRTTIYVYRSLAAHMQMTPSALRREVRISFTKVAEYQARGVVHFHAVIRLDKADCKTPSLPSAHFTVEMLAAAVRDAASAVRVSVPNVGDGVLRELRWGAQLDVRPIRMHSATANPTAIAAYIAKYATKATEALTGRLQSRVRHLHDLSGYELSAHVRQLIETCWRLGQQPQLSSLKLCRWAHMLGFGGHYSTRSRTFSTTLTALRQARSSWTSRRHSGEARALCTTEPWRYVGSGHTSLADALLAATAANSRLHATEEARAQRRLERLVT
jgi:hypothetical protein